MKDVEYDRRSNPFRPAARTYASGNALCLACAANLAYLDPDAGAAATKSWGHPGFRFFDRRGTQGFACSNARTAIVAFRGTQPSELEDVLSDVRLHKVRGVHGTVHRGFKAALDAVWRDVRAHVGELGGARRIWLTGHSLGAALAALAAARLLEEGAPVQGLYTFGQPLVGSAAFAAALDGALEGRYYRFVNNNDVVPRVPPHGLGFAHAGRLVYFTSRGVARSRMSRLAQAADRVRGRIEDLGKPGTDGVKDHDMNKYVRLVRKNLESPLAW